MQHAMFDLEHTRGVVPPLLGEQKDIRYFGTDPRSLLNSPTATGMSLSLRSTGLTCATHSMRNSCSI